MEGHHHIGVSLDAGDRFPQWSLQETRDFLVLRAGLDMNFMETKRNKLLWEVIAGKMKDKGYNRSAEQCKCKWKNLVTRYKGCETMESESMRQQFPFYNELKSIFAARVQRLLWIEAEAGASGSRKKSAPSDDDDDDESDSEKSTKKKRKKATSSSSGTPNTLKEVLEEFTRKQIQMEAQWMVAYEEREKERRMKEMEWRQTMEALESERILIEGRWKEREEQRRMREEARAEKRDALITALLNKLRGF
ncbi:hypothetical protein NMG60_11000179 [Bertholletia excelsa]